MCSLDVINPTNYGEEYMKIKKTQELKICPNCLTKIPLQQKLNLKWSGYKAREGHVFCKTCSVEIK